MEFKLIRALYTISLTEKEYKNIIKHDNNCINDDVDMLHDMLNDITGVDDVFYSEAYVIYIDIDATFDTDATKTEIQRVIESIIK